MPQRKQTAARSTLSHDNMRRAGSPTLLSWPAVPQRGALNRKGGTPLHHQLFLLMQSRIVSGQFSAGELFPTEEALRQEFNVSRATVRRALSTLEANGLVERHQGKATRVRKPGLPDQEPMAELRTHVSDITLHTQVRLLQLCYAPAPLSVQKLFGCDAAQMFQHAIRLRVAKDAPMFYIMTYIPEDIARRFTEGEMASTPLQQLLEREGFRYETGRETISAVLADPTVASALEVEVGAPLLQVRRLHRDQEQRPITYIEMLTSPAMFELEMMIEHTPLPKL